MLPEIWSVTDIIAILSLFFPFLHHWWQKLKFEKNVKKNIWRYHYFTQVYHKWQSYDVWVLRYGAWKTESLVILDIFCPFTSLTTQKNLNFEKMNETPGGIIILYKCPQNHDHIKCTKNHDHMLYCSWDMAYFECNFYFSFWVIFYPFTHLTAQKIKIFKKKKNTWRYHFISLHQKL